MGRSLFASPLGRCHRHSTNGENNGFLQAPPTSYGAHYHNAVVDAAGAFSFQDGGNIGAAHPENDLILNYGKAYQSPRLDNHLRPRRYALHQ